jgi:hypothetical protein
MSLPPGDHVVLIAGSDPEQFVIISGAGPNEPKGHMGRMSDPMSAGDITSLLIAAGVPAPEVSAILQRARQNPV